MKDYSKIARPLNALLGTPTKKNTRGRSKKSTVPWRWTSECQISFDTLKLKLMEPPVLAYADFRQPFIVHTDASTSGLGAALYQVQEGKERVIAYASRGLNPSERNYPAHKLEFLALKWAVTDKFHGYLYGRPFRVITDNNPLTYVTTSAKLDATGHRWLAALSAYDFSLSYRPGSRNGDADGLSRRPHPPSDDKTQPAESTPVELTSDVIQVLCTHHLMDNDTDEASNPSIESVCCNSHIVLPSLDGTTPSQDGQPTLPAMPMDDWRRLQELDPTIKRVINLKMSGHRPSPREESPAVRNFLREWDRLHMHHNVLHRVRKVDEQRTFQLVVPPSHRDRAFQSIHDDVGHFGCAKTVELARQRFYWPGMLQDISERIKSCNRCVRRKTPTQHHVAPLCPVRTTEPLELVSMDYLTLEASKGGIENILVITDHLTKYAVAVPTKHQTAQTTAKALWENFLVHYGFPARFHSDQGRNFESRVIADLCKLANITKTRTTPYHPQGNGQCERFNRTLLDMLGTLNPDQKSDWKSYVRPLGHAYNATKHESTGFAPYFLMFGRHPRLPVDVNLGLQPSPIQSSPSQTPSGYVAKLKDHLQHAYDIALGNIKSTGATNKARYDLKSRENTLLEGDRVLVKKTGIQGKHKKDDIWDRDVYQVVRRISKDISVYDVRPETGPGRTRTLHRNMLLPCYQLSSDQPPSSATGVSKTPSVRRSLRLQHQREEADQADNVQDSDISPERPVEDVTLPGPTTSDSNSPSQSLTPSNTFSTEPNHASVRRSPSIIEPVPDATPTNSARCENNVEVADQPNVARTTIDAGHPPLRRSPRLRNKPTAHDAIVATSGDDIIARSLQHQTQNDEIRKSLNIHHVNIQLPVLYTQIKSWWRRLHVGTTFPVEGRV